MPAEALSVLADPGGHDSARVQEAMALVEWLRANQGWLFTEMTTDPV
jgi:hypothetical protein